MLENIRIELAAGIGKEKQKDLEVIWKRQQGFHRGGFHDEISV